MHNKSVAILGKGPSVKRCTKDFIDLFDLVVVCGRPVFDGYEAYIGERAHYDYSNRTSTSYTTEQKSKLGIRKWVDTGSGTDIREKFKFKDLDPSTGILAFHDFVTDIEYKEIALIGFDLLQTDEKMYYFKNKEFDPALNWLWKDGTYDEDGKLTITSGHNTERTYEYIMTMIDLHPEKRFYVFSSYDFTERKNLIMK